MLAELLRGDHRAAVFLGYRYAGAINAGAKVARVHTIHPSENVSELTRLEPAAFFLIEKNHGTWRETIVQRGGDSACSVSRADPRCILDHAGMVRRLAVEEHQEPKPAACMAARFPSQDVLDSSGGGLIQYPLNAKVLRISAIAASPG